jgi:hypothetical protein
MSEIPFGTRLRSHLTRYRAHYLAFLSQQHRDPGILKSLPKPVDDLHLDDIFVDLSVAQRPAVIAGASRPIWEHLAHARSGHFVLSGPSGSGKTTLLHRIALELADKSKSRHLPHKLPIFLDLNEDTEAVGRADYSLAVAVERSMASQGGPTAPPDWFEVQLQAGRCVVLLDGLDEVLSSESVPKHREMVAWIEAQREAYSDNQFVLGWRPHSDHPPPIEGAALLEIQLLESEQIRHIVETWYRQSGPAATGEGAEDLLRRLKEVESLSEMATNPLLLTLIATVYRFRGRLPERRHELFAETCEILFGQNRKTLEPLAWSRMHDVEHQTQEHQVVLEDGRGFDFIHLAFLEYLAAVHARQEALESELAQKVADPRWHAVLRHYAAQGDAGTILAACFAGDRPDVEALMLAIGCANDIRGVAPEWRRQVDDFVTEGLEDSDPERFRLAAQTLLARRLAAMVPAGEKTFVTPEYVNHTEYQLFIDEERRAMRFRHPDSWTEDIDHPRFPPGEALRPVVGMRASDAAAFCNYLSYRSSVWRYRLPRAGELQGLDLAPPQAAGTARGYWVESDTGKLVFEDATPDPRPPDGVSAKEYLSQLSESDLILDRHRVLTFDRTLGGHFDRVYEIGNRIRDQAAALHGRDAELDLILDRIPTHSLDIEKQLVLNFIHPEDNVGGLTAPCRTLSKLRNEIDLSFEYARDKALGDDVEVTTGHMLQDAFQLSYSLKLARGRVFMLAVHPRDALDLKADRALDLDRSRSLRNILIKSEIFHANPNRLKTFGPVLEYLLLRSNVRSPDLDPGLDPRSIRWLVRSTLLVAHNLGTRRPRRDGVDQTLLDCYADFALLEGRIEGKFPDFEGIRLIKERVT